ncbi:MOSC N-terminal beta barrel domain-containing protein [Saccharopolyspora sp. K220]|uniref:MOSC domain-containing protein n=1 Tax=Saccharopolyspora soli TaxID=2926618 RepID=UPI001F571E66|nr:MOSC N-terminal beta barrel domain-containing protein [Saccharopolyspora soli]MCI2424349.1 MOSC N-terminal beta barrel domain-containing protein [Saccharopolyspora soli]
MAHGSVSELHRWPVKSLRGEPISAARFDARGMAGDRAYALLDERPTRSGNVLTVRQNPEMLSWAASYGDIADPAEPPTLHAPDGTKWSWQDPELADVLADSLDVPLRLHAADGQQDRGPTVLVTFEASRVGLGEELGADVDIRRFRTNLHVTADEPAFVEEDWEPGTVLTAGEVELTVTGEHSGPCIRCAVPSWDATGRQRWRDLQTHLIRRHDNKFGVIMRVTRPGTVRRGEATSVA